jgi:hypothetical protein
MTVFWRALTDWPWRGKDDKNVYRCTRYAQIWKTYVPVQTRGEFLMIPVSSPISRVVVKGGYKTRGVPPPPGIFFLLRAGLGFTPVVNRLIGDFFWGLRQVPAPPPGLNGGVLGGPLPLKMWILPGQGQARFKAKIITIRRSNNQFY